MHVDDALCCIWRGSARGQSTLTVVDRSYANFYEKALFVKVDVATDRSVADATALLFARYASIRTFGELTLWWLGALWDPSSFGLPRRCCHLPSGLPGGWPSSQLRSRLTLDPKRYLG